MPGHSSPRSIVSAGVESAAPLGARLAEEIMGTVFSLDARDGVAESAIDAFFDELRAADARFSTFRLDSETSRLARGELRTEQTSEQMREVLARCEELRRRTRGYFDARASGRLDPSGLVKGWATERAAAVLHRAGVSNYCVNAGGDVLVHGEPADGQRWRVGIRHPERADAIAAVLEAGDLAVATSGAYERGHHVIDPHRGRPARGILSLTVIGPSLATADAYATAGFAMGTLGLAWVATLPAYAGMAIGLDRVLRWTPGFDAARLRPVVRTAP